MAERERAGIFDWEHLVNLAKMMVSTTHKELEVLLKGEGGLLERGVGT